MSKKRTKTPVIRCAIYTRKSSEEGLNLEFNSLDAQRESAEAYIVSQKNEGWQCLPDHYDDGGFTGGNMERPGLKKLMDDIEAGKVDCVVVYKVDRLSRSLLDFARIMETFENHNVSFVSITQQFSTTHSMGRLTLNILLSFAQFEREIIGERIRDKIAAQRRKGKWAGGIPVLGYDVDRSGPSPKLVVNAEEAPRVREIFEMYLDKGSLLPVVQELADREWANKQWQTKAGKPRGGRSFDKPAVHGLLTNPLYVGKIKHKDQVFDGEHPAIVDSKVFKKVQQMLSANGRNGNASRNRHGALLKQLLYCKTCGKTMVHTFSGKRGAKGQQYRYYTCTTAIKNGRSACASRSLPASEIENAVVEQIKVIAKDRALLADVTKAAQETATKEFDALEAERGDLVRQLERDNRDLRELALEGGNAVAARIADLNERVQRAEQRLPEIDQRIRELDADAIDEREVIEAFEDFDSVWAQLSPREQHKLLGLLVERVEFDATDSSIEIVFYSAGIKTLSQIHEQEQAA